MANDHNNGDSRRNSKLALETCLRVFYATVETGFILMLVINGIGSAREIGRNNYYSGLNAGTGAVFNSTISIAPGNSCSGIFGANNQWFSPNRITMQGGNGTVGLLQLRSQLHKQYAINAPTFLFLNFAVYILSMALLIPLKAWHNSRGKSGRDAHSCLFLVFWYATRFFIPLLVVSSLLRYPNPLHKGKYGLGELATLFGCVDGPIKTYLPSALGQGLKLLNLSPVYRHFIASLPVTSAKMYFTWMLPWLALNVVMELLYTPLSMPCTFQRSSDPTTLSSITGLIGGLFKSVCGCGRSGQGAEGAPTVDSPLMPDHADDNSASGRRGTQMRVLPGAAAGGGDYGATTNVVCV